MPPIWAFVAVTVPLVLTPGLSTAVVLRNSINGGTRAGLETAIGIHAGSLCYGLLSAFGLAIALQRWPSIWVVLRTAGVLYLAWLGIRSLRDALASPSITPRVPPPGKPRRSLQNAYEGFATNALNPAIASLYLVVMPQFIPRGAPVVRGVLTLTGVHIAIATGSHVMWAAAGGTLARTLAGGRPRQVLELIAAGAFLTLAVKIALG